MQTFHNLLSSLFYLMYLKQRYERTVAYIEYYAVIKLSYRHCTIQTKKSKVY